ncbi:hypothetical protein FB451DRAFT_1470063 [Mycena latifolia]|nr:hypothetical protein FB451DRAFT_1470063 [Mycena latifolia]
MSPGLRARAPYRPKNALLGGALLAFVAGVFAYALAAVKQDAFDDLDDAVRRAAMSAEDERRAMQMAAAHATGGLVGVTAGAEMSATTAKGAPRPASLSEHARAGAAVRAPTSAEKETPASTPRGVLPALLERRPPWLLNSTRKTLVHGEHSDSLWPPSSSPVSLGFSCPPTPLLPLVLNGMETLTDDFFRYASLVIALVGALGSFLTVELAVPRTSSTYASLTASQQVLWTLLALYLLRLVRGLLWCPACVSPLFLTLPLPSDKASYARLYRGGPHLHRLPHRARDVCRLACEELALLSPDETCARWLERAPRGHTRPHCHLPPLDFLLAVSTHCAHLVAPGATTAGSATVLRPPNARAADVVYAPVHARAGTPWRFGSAADAGLLDARVEPAQLLALLSPDETCERAAVALLAGILVPSVIRLHFLLAVSTHYAHRVATAPDATTAKSATALRPPNVRAADVVYAPVHARSSRGVGPRAAEADAGLAARRAWYAASASGSEGLAHPVLYLVPVLPPISASASARAIPYCTA